MSMQIILERFYVNEAPHHWSEISFSRIKVALLQWRQYLLIFRRKTKPVSFFEKHIMLWTSYDRGAFDWSSWLCSRHPNHSPVSLSFFDITYENKRLTVTQNYFAMMAQYKIVHRKQYLAISSCFNANIHGLLLVLLILKPSAYFCTISSRRARAVNVSVQSAAQRRNSCHTFINGLFLRE